MAVHTLHGMDVVGTGPAFIGCIHDHNVQVATGHGRMAGFTGIPGIIGMAPVACPAANPLMNPRGRAVIFGPSFVGPVGSMALHADALNGVVRDQDPVSILKDIGLPQQVRPEVHAVGPEIEPG